jgi:hypothetical protein
MNPNLPDGLLEPDYEFIADERERAVKNAPAAHALNEMIALSLERLSGRDLGIVTSSCRTLARNEAKVSTRSTPPPPSSAATRSAATRWLPPARW